MSNETDNKDVDLTLKDSRLRVGFVLTFTDKEGERCAITRIDSSNFLLYCYNSKDSVLMNSEEARIYVSSLRGSGNINEDNAKQFMNHEFK